MLKELSNNMKLAGVLAVLGAVAGCANPQPKADAASSGTPAAPQLKQTTGKPAQPILLALRSRADKDYLIQAHISSWKSVRSNGQPGAHKAVVDGVPFVGVASADKAVPYQIVPLTSISTAWTEPDDKAGDWSAAGKVIREVVSAELLLCPAQLAAPVRGDCLVADYGEWEIQASDGYSGRFSNRLPLTTLVRACFIVSERSSDYMGRLPSVDCPRGATVSRLSSADNARLVALKAERAAAYAEVKRKENEQRKAHQRAKEEAEERRINDIIAKAPRGTNLFCESVGLRRPGEPINQGAYSCDRFGSSMYVSLNKLLESKWDIVSESRTPQSNMFGETMYQVSLRLRKM